MIEHSGCVVRRVIVRVCRAGREAVISVEAHTLFGAKDETAVIATSKPREIGPLNVRCYTLLSL